MANVLVVEDNSIDMELVTCILRLHKVEVTEAINGVDALDKLNNGNFDLVLLDIQLPDISGVDILRKIKERPDLCHIPVVALTAYAMKGDKEFFINTGCAGYISKPIFPAQFIKTVDSFLDQGKSGL